MWWIRWEYGALNKWVILFFQKKLSKADVLTAVGRTEKKKIWPHFVREQKFFKLVWTGTDPAHQLFPEQHLEKTHGSGCCCAGMDQRCGRALTAKRNLKNSFSSCLNREVRVWCSPAQTDGRCHAGRTHTRRLSEQSWTLGGEDEDEERSHGDSCTISFRERGVG